ncbi:MAG: protein translocase subunit SecD [Candidatus Levybacteria bacterium]|nr:protein translocase subunit SecD [Candidatus Levybacteria bacterium]
MKPRSLFFLILLITVLAIFINLSSLSVGKINISPNAVLTRFNIQKELTFREGLDLQGGVSLTFKADIADVPKGEENNALESAKDVIERRVNLFGVSEPLVQTSRAGGDYRIIVELPGIENVDDAINLIGTTAQLSFWEKGASASGKIASESAFPIGLTQFLGENPKRTSLGGSDLQKSAVVFDPNTGSPQVQLKFSANGAKKFADITKRNVGKPVAIVLDQYVISAPNVNEPILTGDAVISGSFTQEEAKALSTQLNAGALPLPLSILEQHIVGPTLGIESLKKSLFAGVIGFMTIVIFMITLYGKRGIIASIALILYTFFNLAIFKVSSLTPFGITLTLAGIAGFILSIGMAVDANILIFERIKEELRGGRSIASATEVGFSRAWTSIRDSNSSTLITCFILYTFGTGVIKGFALVLAIGVLVSMFSAITVTRTFLRLMDKSLT